MPSAALLLVYVTLQRWAELVIANRNTRALIARGAYEAGANHYPAMVALHATWLATLWLFGWNHGIEPAFVVLFAALQVGRIWVLRTLGERWTTRIIILPGAAPVTSGPFRFVRHPNYLIVAFELPCLSLAVGLVWHAIVFGVLNLAMLGWRIRSEDAAFAEIGAGER
ncbi:MAG: isoprenylcysteine carboxylmethyltransferase family protein [Candidatus Elarobacter sp.]